MTASVPVSPLDEPGSGPDMPDDGNAMHTSAERARPVSCRTMRVRSGSGPEPPVGTLAREPLRHRLGSADAVRPPRRRARVVSGDRARLARHPRGARACRPRAGRGRVRDDGAGPAGRGGPGAGAAGRGRRGNPEGDPRRHGQQGVRVVDPRDRDRRSHDPRRRARGRRHGRYGVDVQRAVPAPEGALRLSPRQRRGRRPHGLRRADVHLRRDAHGRAGVARVARARHHARGAGRVGVPLAPASAAARRTRGASRTRSSRSATSPPTRASAATRRSRSSRRSSRSSIRRGRRPPGTRRASTTARRA